MRTTCPPAAANFSRNVHFPPHPRPPPSPHPEISIYLYPTHAPTPLLRLTTSSPPPRIQSPVSAPPSPPPPSPNPDNLAGYTRDELLAQLRIMALALFSNEPAGHTLQPTAVVNEAWLRIASKCGDSLHNEGLFREWAGNIVRQVLIDHARKRYALKRDVRRRAPLSDLPHKASHNPEELLILDEHLKELAKVHPRIASIVEFRYFGGMKDSDIALRLAISERTVRSDWVIARAWLYNRMFPPTA